MPANTAARLRAKQARLEVKPAPYPPPRPNEIIVYKNLQPSALAEGRYAAAPEPVVVGAGLDCSQAAFDIQKKGVSARKVIVSL